MIATLNIHGSHGLTVFFVLFGISLAVCWAVAILWRQP